MSRALPSVIRRTAMRASLASWPMRAASAAILIGALSGRVGHAQTVAVSASGTAPADTKGRNQDTRARIQQSLDEITSWVSQHGGRLGAAVVELPSGLVLGARDQHVALNPASNMKIVTAAAALDVLGPAYRYSTTLCGRIQQGVVSPLVLRGHGDPSLVASDLGRLARALASRGIRRVDGIRLDQSRFDAAFVPPAFEQQPNEWAAFRAPVSAIALEQNTVTLHVAPGTAGQPAKSWVEPPGFVEIEGAVRTAQQGQGQTITLSLLSATPKLRARIGGRVAEALPELRFRRRVDDPRLYPGYVLAELLRREGIDVQGTIELGGESETTRITFIESAPLSVLVRELGKQSDNFYAETLFKTLGAETHPGPARAEDGAAAAVGFLRRIGADDSGVLVRNGSGLFDANRLSAHALVRVLTYAYLSPKIGPDFVSHLAIGGVDGTLKSRFRREPSRFAVRAKTGTLNRAVALSGYVLSPPESKPIAFSLLVDGIAGRHADIKQRMDACVERIAQQLWKK